MRTFHNSRCEFLVRLETLTTSNVSMSTSDGNSSLVLRHRPKCFFCSHVCVCVDCRSRESEDVAAVVDNWGDQMLLAECGPCYRAWRDDSLHYEARETNCIDIGPGWHGGLLFVKSNDRGPQRAMLELTRTDASRTSTLTHPREVDTAVDKHEEWSTLESVTRCSASTTFQGRGP